MKLRNKQTRKVLAVESISSVAPTLVADKKTIQLTGTDAETGYREMYRYKSLAELNEVWEDYEDELYYIISAEHKDGCICALKEDYKELCDTAKELGIGFETEKEAEKAVKKLKAWKRLKDSGFRFDHIRSIDGVSIKHKDLYQYTIIAYADEDGCDQECLDLLFGGEE